MNNTVTTDQSDFEKRWSDDDFVFFLLYYYCKHEFLGIKTFARECTFVNAHKICLFSCKWEHVFLRFFYSYKVFLTPMTQIMTLYNSNA